MTSKNKKWYQIKAHDTDIDKVITFWLWGENEIDIMKMVTEKGYVDVEWIAEGKPIFDD
tara:strand:- start:354 stop:530 length:177 start_codon:yes stop_codon:yes gene_type:complete